MEVQVVSNEIIKPSSPTPNNLRYYNLSFLDQISPRAYSPFLYYYTLNDSKGKSNLTITDISQKLKKSLSQALTLYYPLAGRFTNVEKLLECNDEGVTFKEARVIKTRLSEVLNNPVPNELNKLLPFELDEIAEIPAGVQINTFGCGGIAIGVCITHRLGDALSCLMFIRAWMAISRGDNIDDLARPEFNSDNLLPPRDMDGYDPSIGITKNMFTMNITKRFVFDARRIEALRSEFDKKLTSQEGLIGNAAKKKRVSRIEAVSAFIWTRFSASVKLIETEPPEKPYVVLHAVNIRPKFDPPLSQHSFGNYYTTSVTIGFVKSIEESNSHGLARKIGEDIRRIDKGFVDYVRVFGDEYMETLKRETAKGLSGETLVFVFSSLCRFPLYDADFGFGKPTWVSSAARGLVNAVGFMDNEAGDGIEAYICLRPHDMERLEADKEFLSFTSPDSDLNNKIM